MIIDCQGDLLQADAEAPVNTVNTVGTSAKGLALQFRLAFPDNDMAYRLMCARGMVQPGRMFVFETGRSGNPHLIINFPTKRHWRRRSRLDDIEAGLQDLARVVRERGVQSVAVPALGCGLGGLAWTDVRPLIVEALGALPVSITARTAGEPALVALVRKFPYIDAEADRQRRIMADTGDSVSKITAKGQTTVPKAVRRALGVDYGGRIAYRIEHGRVILRRAEVEHRDPALRGFLKLMAGDIAKGRNVKDLPGGLQRALRKALMQGKIDLDTPIEGEVSL